MKPDSINITAIVERYLQDLLDCGGEFSTENLDEILVNDTCLGVGDRREVIDRAIEEWGAM